VARAQGSQQETKKGDLNVSISHSMSDFKRKCSLKFP
jgi:hypothetical protein